MQYDCPFCHHQDAVVYLKGQTLRDGQLRDIYKCSECALLYPRPRTDEVESSNYLIKQYTLTDNLKLVDPTKMMERYVIKSWIEPKGSFINLGLFLRKWVLHKGNALDIGTFLGQFCFILQSMGFEAYGLELHDNAARIAREKGLRVFTGSFPNFIPEEITQIKFSLISMLESMYYITDLKKGLQKIYEMLDDDGFFLVKCHQGRSRYYRNGQSFFKRYADNVQIIPTLDPLKYCMEKSGFETVYVRSSISEVSSPISFNKLSKRGYFRKLFFFTEAVLNKVYETFFLDNEDADQLIILAKKRVQKCLN